jgi:hypothetical protein
MLERAVRAAGSVPLPLAPMPAVGVVGSPMSPGVLKSDYGLLSGLELGWLFHSLC